MKQVKGNKLIAEFMGATFNNTNDGILVKSSTSFAGRLEYCLLHKIEYHCSWDWLMLVVEKIEELGYDTTIRTEVGMIIDHKGTIIADTENSDSGLPKIEAVWIGVIQFIKWYNKNK